MIRRFTHKSTFLKTISISLLTLSLSACGFQLRSSDDTGNAISTIDVANNKKTASNAKPTNARSTVTVKTNNSSSANHIRELLIQQLQAQGINIEKAENNDSKQSYKPVVNSASSPTETIKITEVQLQKQQLVGVLTEVNMAMLATVVYQTLDDKGQLKQTIQPIILQKSYQYNKASVNTNNQQEKAIQAWLNQLLVQRIYDQYFALSNK